jgi:hypothetical protein
LAEIRTGPTIAAFSTLIVASKSWISERLPNVVWMYLRKHVVVRAAASAPRHANASPNHQGFIAISAKSDCGGTWPRSSLLLRRARFRSRYRGPALVKTRSRGVSVVCQALRRRRSGGRRSVRSDVGGSRSNGEQGDSDKPGNRSMLRHQDLLRWSPLVWVTGILRRFNSDATIMDCANSQIGERSCSRFRLLLRPGSGCESVNSRRPSASLRIPDSGRTSC